MDSHARGIRKSQLPPELDILSERIISAAMDVHRALGPGYLESIYEQAMVVELELRHIPFVRQGVVSLTYKGVRIGEQRLDFIVADAIILELKAVDVLSNVHQAQVISYLKASGLKLGLLLNFNVSLLRHGLRRLVHPDYYK
ncbi:MAG: GxxExxY protein [Thermoflexales bacterium]